MENALEFSEIRCRRLFETAKDGIILLNAETGQIEDVNPYLMEMLGYSYKKFLGKKLWEIGAFKKFAEASSLAYGFADLNGDIIYINQTLCRILGEERPEDALRKNGEIYYPDNMKSKLINEVLPTVKTKGGWTGEIPLQSIKGKVTPTIQNVSLIHDDKGKPLYIGNIITDITERKRSEEENQKKVKELEDFYRMAVGRENRMMELKKEIEKLKEELEKYKKQKN
jgi:PAS domain S-box-containing protein